MTEPNDVSPSNTWWKCMKLPMFLDFAWFIFVRSRNKGTKQEMT